MHELRKDPLLNRWVAILKNSMPPDSYLQKRDLTHDTADETNCILCPGREHETPKEIFATRETPSSSNTPNWQTRVIPKIDPIFQIEGDLGRKASGMYDKMNSIGAHEIIIESPHHAAQPEDLGISHMTKVITTYRHRITDLENDPRLRYTIICKNSGKSAGELYPHPHSEVIATPVIPKGIKEELDGAKAYFYYKERCIYCDILNDELKKGSRIIMESRDFVAFIPFAPSFPFEYWLMPKRHNCAFQEITDDELEDLSIVLTTTIKRMKKTLDNPSYNYVIHTAPNRMPRKDHWHTLGEDFHWHIEVMPQVAIKNGFERSAEFYILTTSPEDAARYLRGE